MRKLITSILVAIFSVIAVQTAQAQFTNIGVGLMYGTEIEQPGLRVDGVYQINEEFRAVADLGIFLPDKYDTGGGNTTTASWWELNFNGNYLFHNDAETGVKAYALAGLNYLNYKVESEGQFGGEFSDSEVGLNIGAGAEYAMDFGDLFGELKYVLGDFDQLNIGVGVRFGIGGN
ncbi:MAG: outer membrane beta-barrel protein [Gracilimonas sp.]